jgi:putative ABC transport system permease protein
MLLVTGAGLMTKTFLALQAVDLGFEAERLLTMEITLPTSRYGDEAAENRYFDRAVERLRSLPGVESAASVYPLPLNHESLGAEFEIEGREPASPDETLWTNTFWVGTDYFATMEIPLMTGRSFTVADDADSEKVVVLNRRFAERFWPNESPIGARVRIGEEWRTVVGVVADSIAFSLDEETPLILYYPQEQRSTRRRFLMVRTAGAPMTVYPSAEAVLREIDPAQPIQNARPMTEVVTANLGPWLMGIGGLGFVGFGALFLAAMGLYGVISYSVNRRVQELGIRSALGAQGTDLLGLVLRQGLSLAAVGIAIGLVGALVLSRFLQSLLFGVGSLDPVTFLVTPLVLLAVTFLATFLPARRATRVDPMVALRYE